MVDTVSVEYVGGPEHGRVQTGQDPQIVKRLPQVGDAFDYRRVVAHEAQPGAPKHADPVLLFHKSITEAEALQVLRERGQA